MTQVDRITEDIAHMPVAAFIFRDRESYEVFSLTLFLHEIEKQNDEVQSSSNIR